MTKHITSLSLDTKINDADIVKHRILSALRNFYVDSISLEDDKKETVSIRFAENLRTALKMSMIPVSISVISAVTELISTTSILLT